MTFQAASDEVQVRLLTCFKKKREIKEVKENKMKQTRTEQL
jgi:hypothetical protein